MSAGCGHAGGHDDHSKPEPRPNAAPVDPRDNDKNQSIVQPAAVGRRGLDESQGTPGRSTAKVVD